MQSIKHISKIKLVVETITIVILFSSFTGLFFVYLHVINADLLSLITNTIGGKGIIHLQLMVGIVAGLITYVIRRRKYLKDKN